MRLTIETNRERESGKSLLVARYDDDDIYIYIYIYIYICVCMCVYVCLMIAGKKLKEVRDFVNKASAGSAPGMNGISHKLYKNCPHVLRKLTVLLRQVCKKDIVPQEWCLADGIWIPKEMQSRGITNFCPISLLNVERKIFFGVLGRRMATFLMRNHYINTSVQKAGIPGFPGCLEHSQMIWNSMLSAKKGQNRTTCNLAWSCQCIRFISAPFNSNGPRLFQLP